MSYGLIVHFYIVQHLYLIFVDSYRRTLELTEIEERLQALETANAKFQSKNQEIGKQTQNSKETVQILLGRRNFFREFLRLNLLGDKMGDTIYP